jgi:drug/metabolite transporter (DMT)-like permease
MKLCSLVNVMQMTYMVSNIIGKTVMLNQGVSILDFAFFRFFVIQIVANFLLKINGKHPIRDLPIDSRWAMFTRAFVGTLAFTVCNIGILLLPLAVGTLIVYVAPFFTAILTRFFLNEEVALSRWLFMIGSFAGILLISLAGTDALTPNHVDENSFFGQFSETGRYMIGVSSSFCTSIFLAILSVATRKLKPVHYSVVQFWYSLFAFCSIALL